MNSHRVRVRISGEFACFTRPEAKVERVSYPAPTPSAARNILDAICWRPEMRWVVTSISLLKPIRFVGVRRNEVQSKIAPSSVKSWMEDPSQYEPLAAGTGAGTDGTQRNSLLLRDVAYVIEAYPLVFNTSGDNTAMKYCAMLERRVEKGQCFQRPSLGCREFAADFGPARDGETIANVDEDIGRMLYGIVFRPQGNRAVFFDAKVVKGVLDTRPEAVLGAETAQEVTQCSYKL